MNKLLRIIVIVIILGGFLTGFYFLFMKPIGFVTQEAVVSSYINNLDAENCETHFITEMQDVCTQFVTLLDGEDFEVVDITASTNTVDVTLKINEIEETFTFFVVTEEPGGLRGILTNNYYKIDHIE